MPEPLLHFSLLDGWLTPRLDATRWCVAFSGGPDSTALLHLVHSWCVQRGQQAPTLVAVHVNHGMQDEADHWQAHCESLCSLWQIPIIVHRASVENDGQGAEAAARKARYQNFEAELQPGEVLLMGHHLDDQVETYFLRLMRGSGLSGLSAMPAQRNLGAGELIRPLLKNSRQSLQRYVSEHQLKTIVDPSNLDTTIDRNFLRQSILPLLETRWRGYRQTVARAAEHAAVSQAVVEECLPPLATLFSVLGDPGFEQGELNGVSVQAAMIKLRRWLRTAGYPMPDQLPLEEFMRQLREGSAASSPRLACSSYQLQRYQSRIFLLPQFIDEPEVSNMPMAMSLTPGEKIDIAGVGEVAVVAVSGSTGLRLHEGDQLELRWRQGGERCRPRGRHYHQRLKKLFQEFAVPPWWRERVPLLYLDQELLAVGELWLCESSRLCSQADGDTGLWCLSWQRKPCAFN